MASADHTEAELRRAWRECAPLNISFSDAMEDKTLAIVIRLKADSNRRHQQRSDRQQFDPKRAQANDHD